MSSVIVKMKGGGKKTNKRYCSLSIASLFHLTSKQGMVIVHQFKNREHIYSRFPTLPGVHFPDKL